MRIAFIGNCQVESFAVSATHMLDDAEISTFDYSHFYSRDEEARRRYVLGLHSTDYVFAQTATFSHTSEHDLREVLGDRLVTIANFYFRGLFPETCYVGDFHSRLDRPSALHSVIVLDGFLRGLSEEAVCARFDGATLDGLGLGEAWSSSMTEMRAREANGVLDVPVGDMMEEACRHYPAFLTMNHPSGRLITEYFSKVLDHVGMRHRMPAADTYPDALARHDMVPIHDFVAERHGLAYRTRQSWKVNALGGVVSREAYVASCYRAYAHLDPASLLVHSPTDLVTSLRRSAYRHLVEHDGGGAGRSPGLPDAATRSRERRLQATLGQALQPIVESVDKISAPLEKLHAMIGKIDPRLAQLAHALADRDEILRHAARENAAAKAEILAGVGDLRDRLAGVHRLVAVAIGLTVLAVAIEVARFVHAR